MSLLVPTNKVRIYRASQEYKHDLNILRTLEDVNGEDVWAMIRTSDMDILDITVGLAMIRYCTMHIDSRHDCDYHYALELKKSRVLHGIKEPVQEALAVAATAGALTLTLPKTVGFGQGDMVVIGNGEHWEEVRVKSTTSSQLRLYSDNGLQYSYDTGALVRASSFWQVVKAQGPEVIGPTRIVTLAQLGRHEAVS